MPTEDDYRASIKIAHAALGMNADERESRNALLQVIFALVQEVEALRTAIAHLPADSELRRRYRKAYEESGVLAHNGAGVTLGWEKLLGNWFKANYEPRELAMLERLGLTPEELEKFRKDAEFANQLS